MIIVAGRLEIDPAQADACAAGLDRLNDEATRETGCKHYSVRVEDRSKATVSVCEIWQDEKALYEHLQQDWVQAFFSQLMPHVRDFNVKMYDATNERDLPN